jgi:D-alanyl-D-alanine carboxypeptidase (penicillin-binding protein 5/6)
MDFFKSKKGIISIYVASVVLLLALFVAWVAPALLNGRSEAVLHGEDSEHAIAYVENVLEVDITSPQSFVYDVSNDTIIFTKGEDKVVYPGSTTKLFTALYALSVLPEDAVITPGSELSLVKEGSSVAYIKSGHKLTVSMLVEGMLIPSGNDAAYVLAAAAGRVIAGDESLDGVRAADVFMGGLNSYAEKIGLCGTYFTVPDGYAEKEHYTTTEDMAIIARLAAKNELISEYVSKPTSDVVYASGHTNTWINTNKLIDPVSPYYSRYAKGLKTGSIDDEYSLVFSFEFDDGREYIAGVFGAETKNARFEDALKIIDALESN